MSKTGKPNNISSLKTYVVKLVAGVLLVDLFVILLACFFLNQSRIHYEQLAEARTLSLSQLVAQNIGESIDKIDLTLLATVDEIEKQLASSKIENLSLETFLSRQLGRIPEMARLMVTNAQGEVIFGGDGTVKPRISLSERDYFIRLRNDPSAKLVIGKSVLGVFTKVWTQSFARRINNPDGSFAGVAIGSIRLQHFQKLFSSIDVGKNGAIVLRDKDIAVVVRYPESKVGSSDVGQNMVCKELQELLASGKSSGTIKSISLIDNIERISSYCKISGYPKYLVIGMATSDILADWRHDVVNASLMVSIFILLTLFSSWLLISNWKRETESEKTLYESEEKFRAVAYHTYDWEYWKDADGVIIYMSPSCERITGYNAEEFQQDPELLTGIIQPDDRHKFVHHPNFDADGMTMGDCQTMDFRIKTRSGEEIWIAHVCQEIFDREGKSLGRRASNRDITSRKRTEEKLLILNHQLENANFELLALNAELEQRRLEAEENQEKLQQLSRAVENSPAGVVITDYSGRIEYVNPKFTEMTGYLPEEAIGQNPRILNAGVQSKEFYRELWETIRAGREWRGDFCSRKKNGDIHWEHALISPIRDDMGNITHFVAIKDDITEDKRIADELVAARNAADAANRAKSSFLSNMSHEIRTPLSAIIGFSDLCLRTALPPKQHDYVQKIQNAGELLLNIVNDILDFSKIEAGHLKMEQIPFRLDTVIANVISTVQQKAHDKGLNLQVENIPEVTSRLVGDPHRLGQIFINLLSNAVKFTAQGEIVLKAELLKQESDRLQLVVSVHDSGIGISAEDINNLFESFTQADSTTTRRFGGTGLGLSISKQLVDLMGGEIWCESKPGEGSTFCFTAWFGLGKASELGQYLSININDNMQPYFDFSGFHILLVDDSETNRQLAIEILKETGVVVNVAANGKEAVEIITGGATYDMVLMDIQMPVMDGYEATRLIREDGRFASLPIIAMTAHAMEEERQKILEAGIDAHITKPIDARTMLQVIKFFLREQESSVHLNERIEDNSEEPAIPYIVGLDSAAALGRLDGDRNLYLWVLRTFVENELNVASLIEEALRLEDTKLALRHVHTIKGTAGSIGAVELEALALSLENVIGQSKSPTNVKKTLDRFATELNRLVSEISNHLPTPQQTDNDIIPGTVDRAVVTPIFNRLLEYINGMDGKAERYLDDFNEELAGLPIIDIEKIKAYLNKFEFALAHDALMALSARSGIVLSVDGTEDYQL